MYNVVRYIYSYVAAVLGLILLAPFVILAAIAIVVETKGSPIFLQIRVGKNKQPFVCYKLRTMFVGTPQSGSHEVGTVYVTRVGEILRKTKIDEIPQLINVLKGDMWLVGYRPSLPGQQDVVDERQRRNVHDDRPGITGLSQINRIDMSTPVLIAETDSKYHKARSTTKDLKILVSTVLGKGSGDAAEI